MVAQVLFIICKGQMSYHSVWSGSVLVLQWFLGEGGTEQSYKYKVVRWLLDKKTAKTHISQALEIQRSET